MTRFTFAMLVSLMYLALCGLFGYLGYQYIYEGFGLHPGIAFPVSFLCLAVSVFWPVFCEASGADMDEEPYLPWEAGS